MRDGVYVDAATSELGSGYGAVLVRGGAVVARASDRDPHERTSHLAEARAIEWGRQIFPGRPVFSDCKDVAEPVGATWIPREENRQAHRIAYREHEALKPRRVAPPPPMIRPVWKPKNSRESRRANARHRAGGGCRAFKNC